MGYPTPEQIPLIADAGYRGICVYVPNEPEYLQALLGSLHGLASWNVWERDDDQSGAKSAALWKVANAMTTLNWASDCATGCDDMAFDCEAMKECLIAVAEAISVNVTVNNSCSASGGGGTMYCVNDDGTITVNPPPVTDTDNPPAWDLPPDMTEPPAIDLNDPDPPDGFETWDDYNVAACEAANALVSWAIDALQFIRDILTERIYQITAVFALVVNFFTGRWGLVFSSAMVLKIAQTYARMYSWIDPFTESVDSALLDLQTNKEDYVCQLYQMRENSADWENWLINTLFTASSGGLDAGTQQPVWKDLLSFLLPAYTGLNSLFGGLTYTRTQNIKDCSECLEPNDGSWVIDYTSGKDGVTSLTEVANYFAKLSLVGDLYKDSTYAEAKIVANLAMAPNTIDGAEQITVNVKLNSDEFGTLTARFERDLGIELYSQALVDGVNVIPVYAGQANTQNIELKHRWAWDRDPFPKHVDMSADFTLPEPA